MTWSRTAFAALLVCLSVPVAAQDQPGAAPVRPATGDKATPSPRDPVTRPKGGGLFDLIKIIAPPLIEAAKSRRPSPREPVPKPIAPPAPAAAASPVEPALALAPAGTGTVVVPPSPRPVEARPTLPAPSPPPPAAIARPQAPPPVPSAPASPIAPPAQTRTPLAPPATPLLATPPRAAPPVASPVSPPPPRVRAEPPPAPAEPQKQVALWGSLTTPSLAIFAAILGLVGAHHLRRMRRIARTRAALGLSPRLDAALGAGTISGLTPTGPSLTIGARLAPTSNS